MSQKTGPPTRRKRGHGLALGMSPMTEPVVATLERAAHLLDCEPGQLADALAALEPWGTHASGADVWRWPELVEAAGRAGIQVPETRPTMAAWKAMRRRKAGPP